MTTADLIQQQRARHEQFVEDVKAQVSFRSWKPAEQEFIVQHVRAMLDADLARFTREVLALIGDTVEGMTKH